MRPTIVATLKDGALSLQVNGAPLAEVLRAIGQAGGFRVELRGALAIPVRETFSEQPLEDAIRRLVGERTLVMIHRRSQGVETPALVEVRVTEQRGAAATRMGGAPEDAEEDVAPSGPSGTPLSKEDILLDLLEPEPATRMAAVPKVGSLSPGDAYEVLSHVFRTEPDSLVRSRAVAAATRLRGPAAAALLRGRALDDVDAALRAQALNALAATEGERSTTVFGRALRLDADPEVRLTAIRALQRVGGKWARGYLERATADSDLRISHAAEQALAGWPQTSD